MQNFYADLPPSLYEADDILSKYGRWAMSRPGPESCGSAEGAYRAPGGQALEDRRAPIYSAALTMQQRVSAQRALSRVPEQEREILVALYIRKRALGRRLRELNVPPRLAQERHVAGLRMWWNVYCIDAARNSGTMRAT